MQLSSQPAPPLAATLTPRPAAAPQTPHRPIGALFDLAGIDLSTRLFGRERLENLIPHRGAMLLLDAIVHLSDDFKRGVAVKHIREDEFWCHPGRGGDSLPGLLMIEAGAQLACCLFNCRSPERPNAAFLRLEETSIRVVPRTGDDLFILCSEVRWGRRRFVSDIQGILDDRVAFAGRISGMAI